MAAQIAATQMRVNVAYQPIPFPRAGSRHSEQGHQLGRDRNRAAISSPYRLVCGAWRALVDHREPVGRRPFGRVGRSGMDHARHVETPVSHYCSIACCDCWRFIVRA